MPPFLAVLLEQLGSAAGKAVFNLFITTLQKTGVLTKFEAGAVKTGDNFLRVVDHLKTYSAPTDFPDCPPQAVKTNFNLQ